MNRSRVAGRRFLLPILLTVFMAGCAPIQLGPTVMSSMGPGKTFDIYQADLTSCKGFASEQVKGSTSVMNQRVVDAILSGQDIDHSNDANDHAYIQQQYDSAFSQCMVSRGENVPGLTPAPAVASTAAVPEPPDPVVRATQVELIRLGYLTGGADGYRGPRTRAAIVAYERANGLAADGNASQRLLARLQASSAGATTSAAPANWVAPTSGAAAPAAAAPSGWVSPTSSPAGPSASATGSSGWVAPTKGP